MQVNSRLLNQEKTYPCFSSFSSNSKHSTSILRLRWCSRISWFGGLAYSDSNRLISSSVLYSTLGLATRTKLKLRCTYPLVPLPRAVSRPIPLYMTRWLTWARLYTRFGLILVCGGERKMYNGRMHCWIELMWIGVPTTMLSYCNLIVTQPVHHKHCSTRRLWRNSAFPASHACVESAFGNWFATFCWCFHFSESFTSLGACSPKCHKLIWESSSASEKLNGKLEELKRTKVRLSMLIISRRRN